MKRVISVFLAFLLVVGLSPVTRAAGAPTVSVTSGEVSAGGEVTLTVSIEDNPGVAACLIYIYYDTSVFTVDPGEDLSAAGSFRSSGGLIGNTIALAKQNGCYTDERITEVVEVVGEDNSVRAVIHCCLETNAIAVYAAYDVDDKMLWAKYEELPEGDTTIIDFALKGNEAAVRFFVVNDAWQPLCDAKMCLR